MTYPLLSLSFLPFLPLYPAAIETPMKMKNNKGKIHPSPSQSSPKDSLSVLKLLPTAILTLISLLSLQDKQTLAYMLTRSLNPPKFDPRKPKLGNKHKPPVFDCDCFECYTIYWYKWDTSPNKEIIHQAIEAFEELEEKQREKRGNKKREKAAVKEKKGKMIESFDVGAPKNEVAKVVGDDDVAPAARKVMPDVVGMIGSRLWSFWNPGSD